MPNTIDTQGNLTFNVLDPENRAWSLAIWRNLPDDPTEYQALRKFFARIPDRVLVASDGVHVRILASDGGPGVEDDIDVVEDRDVEAGLWVLEGHRRLVTHDTDLGREYDVAFDETSRRTISLYDADRLFETAVGEYIIDVRDPFDADAFYGALDA